ncbi:BgTH12-04671 [Blumeria graminis f. sp. triticale]|uniref:Dicer-like protein 1 n=1 Tax=Blumeria graminis f. sp. triticale TaxID=1689686 RepID=A0A9W4CV92_BLUGR|nr:BgTH12-04671 [Blumeria graminis f. sp. triticale]
MIHNQKMSSDHKPEASTTSTIIARSEEALISELSAQPATDLRDRTRLNSASFTTKTDESCATESSGLISSEHKQDNSEDSEDDNKQEKSKTVPESLKVAERKRRQNAVAAEYIKNINKKLVKEANKTQPGDDANQSTKWLVNQSENRKIISTPREYQVELFNRAKQKNIIAVLDTGSGKTLIAVLLLRHIISQELEDRALGKNRRISFFLVDSVQLVFQQHAVLKANLNSPMAMFCGDMGCDLWSKELWENHFQENEIIVCTAEILRQCLHHSFIRIQDINLLIFDEAHHAKKDHAYARIIKDFFATQQADSCLPRIFGMTASPVDARVDVRKAASELETILHCQIATIDDENLLQLSHKNNGKTEQLARYASLAPRFKTPLYQQMYDCFFKNKILIKPLLFSYQASSELGAWCSDQIWLFCLSDNETKKLLAKAECQGGQQNFEPELEVIEKTVSQIQNAKEIIQNHIFNPPDYSDSQSWSNNLSSKVVLLIRYLRERFERETTDKCIIFVKQRYTARVLTRLLEQERIKTKWLRVGALVGTRSGEAGDLNTSFRDQVITMMQFRKGKLNCLIATSVAEEGLDVPDCNLVIRFDLYSTLIQHIQSRGRARHANSNYLHFCEAGNQDHSRIIMEVRKNESILRDFCRMLPEDRKLTGNDITIDDILAKEKYNRVIKIPETGAQLNYKMSLVVLANFVDRLPNAADGNLQVEYVMISTLKKFQCEAILPESSPVRGAIGEWCSTKQVAKCSAAFETCLKLLEGKYLDNWLIPTFSRKILPAMRNAKLALDSKKRSAYTMRTKPELWSITSTTPEFYVNVLVLEQPESVGRRTQPLALLTRSHMPHLPSFMLHFGGGCNSLAHCISLGAIKLDADMIEQINTFTLCIFNDVFSKCYESDSSKMPYFLVPAKDSFTFRDHNIDPFQVVDWEAVTKMAEYQIKWSKDQWGDKSWMTEKDEFLADRFIIDPYDGSRKLYSIGVTKDYKPLDPVPPNTAPRSGARKNNDNIMEYSCSLWAKARAQREFDVNQRVVEAEYISLRRNLLDQFDVLEDHTPKQCFIILEPLKISQLSTKVVAMAYIFPAIIHRIESYLIALEACELLHLELRPELALEAVTKDSDNSGQDDETQINFQRGMGNNYERLEFLGDCFLKMATSISLYGLQPENNEFAYHVDRMLLTSNKNLKDNALKLKLYEFIRSQSFNRRAWYPEGLVLLKGKTAKAPKSHDLADKTIADVCEALIGAALLSYHETKNMDMAVRAVTELVCSDHHRATSFSDYYKLYVKPKYQIQPSTQSQLLLASDTEKQHPYKFRYPRLLCSAFTHSSFPRSFNGKVPSYQRLEFLGDALLDMACINYLFHNFPNKDPQWLTEHKMAMVSNMFLGALCVHLGFHRHLLVFNSTFMQQIGDYIVEVTEARLQSEKEATDAGKSPDDCSPDYWISVRQPPKCLPDIVEAYIGAIFVDSEYDYAEVEKFFDAHIVWFFRDMSVYDTFANNHPTTFLSNFLEVSMGCHAWSMKVGDIPNDDGGKGSIVVMVIIHGTVIAHARAESSRYAKINAAKSAMEILDGIGLGEFRMKYECDCKPIFTGSEKLREEDLKG